MLPFLTLLPRSSASRRTPWDRGGCVRGRSPPAVATVWLGRCPSTPCANHHSRGFYTDLQGPAGGSDQHSFEYGSFHPPDRCAPSFLTRSDSRRPTLARRTASHGVVKYRPSVVSNRRVNSAAFARRRATATGPGLPHPTAFRPRGFHHLDGLLLLDGFGMLHPNPTLGFVTFRPAANRLPRDAFLPSRALLPDGSGEAGPKSHIAGDRHRGPALPPCHRSPVALPPRRCVVVTLARNAGRDREALLHHRSRCVSSRCRSDPPDALLGLYPRRRRLAPHPVSPPAVPGCPSSS